MEMGSRSLGGTGASGSNDSLIGLKFGKKIYFEDVGSAQTSSSSSSSRPPVSSPSPPAAMAPAQGRRGRGAVQGGGAQQPPRCQVEGCGQDLTGAKAYYCRHKVCGAHSKSPKVVVAGIEQRFCQQCSRFHQLPEFDQGKRSCRRRLAGHNERRRKPPSGSFSSRYGQLSSSFHEDGGRFGGFLMDFTCPRLPGTARDLWPTTGTSERVTTGSQWPGRLDMPPSGRVAGQVVVPYSQGSAGGTLFSTHEIPSGESLGVSDSSCALSLLSTQQWGTTPSGTRGSAIIDNNFGGVSMAQSSNASSFLDNPWNSNRHGTNSSIIRGISHDVGFGQATEPGGSQFSGEPELAPLSNRPCMEHGHGRPYGSSSNHMHWPH